jgi:hypothetical protein
MSAPATAKTYLASSAPARIQLLGDKTKRPESATHVIEFPGGAIELSRTSDGAYWAHIIVHHGQPIPDARDLQSKRGDVVDARIDRDGKVDEVRDVGSIRQLAVLIRPGGRS